MSDKIVVTNLRIPEEDLLKLKTMASEMNMSFNEYVRYLLEVVALRRELGLDDNKVPKKKTGSKNPIWSLTDLSREENHPTGELSEEDKIIYG